MIRARPQLRIAEPAPVAPTIDTSMGNPYADTGAVSAELKLAILTMSRRSALIERSLCGGFSTLANVAKAKAVAADIARDFPGLLRALERLG